MKNKLSFSTNKIKLRMVRIFVIVLIAITTYYFAAPNFLQKSDVIAIGDLTINWGVPTGDPIFVVTNFLPGDVEDRNVVITNSGTQVRPVGIRGVQTNVSESLENVIDFVISEGGNDIYGGTLGNKTLAQFFADSGGPNGLFLFNLNPSQTKTVNFEATFQSSAGNEFQNTEVIFDLIIGISIDIPDECDGIDLLPTPIIGTSKAETLTGTPGNDLILGLEGADIINGNNGDDCILGGSGAENKIHGNNGNDVIFGEAGADHINGNNGDDLIFGGTGADVIDGGNGNDHLVGNEQADKLDGGNGDDLLEGNEGPDSLRGGNGDDILNGNDGADSLRGDAGDDQLFGGAGMDSANGNTGTDTCVAESEISCEI